MSDGMMFTQNENGEWEEYNDAYDITIHCESAEEQEKILNIFRNNQWIPCSERLPEEEEYILLSFADYTGLDIGRYEKDGENSNFYPGDEEESYASYGLVVNAWMPLPEPYRQNDEGVEDDEIN